MGQSSILIRFFLILEGALFSCDITVVFTFQKFIKDIPMFLFMLAKSNIMPKRNIISFIVMPTNSQQGIAHVFQQNDWIAIDLVWLSTIVRVGVHFNFFFPFAPNRIVRVISHVRIKRYSPIDICSTCWTKNKQVPVCFFFLFGLTPINESFELSKYSDDPAIIGS